MYDRHEWCEFLEDCIVAAAMIGVLCAGLLWVLS
jgi:hypothetical protein